MCDELKGLGLAILLAAAMIAIAAALVGNAPPPPVAVQAESLEDAAGAVIGGLFLAGLVFGGLLAWMEG